MAFSWVACLLLVPQVALGYVRSLSKDASEPLKWQQSCIALETDARGGPDASGEELAAALARSVERWQSRITACSYLQVTALPASGPRAIARDDHWVVGFQTDWPDGEEAQQIAVTGSRSLPAPHAGEVLEADIRLNAKNFTFTVGGQSLTPRPGTQLADLDYTLTHELGHVLGFGHSCWINDKDRALVEDNGRPIPACATLAERDVRRRSVMFPTATASPGWQLADEDVRGVCQVYSNQVPVVPACYRVVTGGCSASGDGPHPAAAMVLFLACAAVVRRMGPRSRRR